MCGAAQTAAFVSLASDPNEDFRDHMEDGHKVVEPLLQGGGRRGEQVRWGFFAVYDGHGGRQEVDYCEKKLHDVVLAELRAMVPGPNCQEGVKAALASAFKKVDRQLEMLGAWSSGCTATVALVRRQSAGERRSSWPTWGTRGPYCSAAAAASSGSAGTTRPRTRRRRSGWSRSSRPFPGRRREAQVGRVSRFEALRFSHVLVGPRRRPRPGVALQRLRLDE
ncbi:unnamed protein product, partial [Prorocentrum cordatum]